MNKKLFTIICSLAILLTGVIAVKAESLWTYYQSIGEPMPSYQERAEMAAEKGIWYYRGTAEQNGALLALLKAERDPEKLGANPVTRYKTTLNSSMTSSQTTVPVSTLTTFDGHTLTMADLGGEVYLSIEPGTNSEEIVRCTAITSTYFSSCTRGLAFYGESTASVTANKKSHNAGSIVIMSNVHYVYDTITKANTWTSIQTFASSSDSTTQRIQFGTSTMAYFENLNGVLFYCNNGASCAAVGGGANTYSFIRPLAVSGTEVKLATSTYDFDFRDNLLALATSSVSSGTASGNALDDMWNYRWNSTTTRPGNLTIEGDLNVGDDTVMTGDLTVNGTSYASFIPYYGDGSDGNLTVTSANFFPNSASSTVSAAVATSTTSITVADASQFATSTYIFIHAVRGENAGRWEIKEVTDRNVDTDVVTLDTATINSYKTTSGANITQVLKVPQYNKVVFSTSGGIDTRQAWTAGHQTLGGVVVFYAKEGVIIKNGVTLSLSGFGFKSSLLGFNGQNYSGEGTAGAAALQTAANGTGGGGANAATTVGAAGYDFIDAVNSIFNKSVSVYIGGAGGNGNNGNSDGTGSGGYGGGVFMPITPSFINFGTLTLTGVDGNTPTVGNIGGGGGGAGGALIAICEQYYEGTVTLTGGAGGTHSGSGGKGGGGGGSSAAGTAGGANDGGAGAAGYKVYGWIANLLPND